MQISEWGIGKKGTGCFKLSVPFTGKANDNVGSESPILTQAKGVIQYAAHLTGRVPAIHAMEH